MVFVEFPQKIPGKPRLLTWSVSCASQSTKETIGDHVSLGHGDQQTSEVAIEIPRPKKRKASYVVTVKFGSFPSHKSLLFCGGGPKHVPTCYITGVI